jgi:hypothetical protein
MVTLFLNIVHSLLPELSNSGSPPAEPGVYLKEIIGTAAKAVLFNPASHGIEQ